MVSLDMQMVMVYEPRRGVSFLKLELGVCSTSFYISPDGTDVIGLNYERCSW